MEQREAYTIVEWMEWGGGRVGGECWVVVNGDGDIGAHNTGRREI